MNKRKCQNWAETLNNQLVEYMKIIAHTDPKTF